MQNKPKLRFKEFNDSIVECRIENVLKIKHGKDQKAIECEDGIYPILATSGEIGRTNTYLWNKPCVLIGRKGTINKPQYMDTPFWTVDTLFYSDVNSSNNAKYLYYLFNTINWKKYDESTGVPSLSAKTVERIKIIITNNKDEQTKIAEFLSKVDEVIAEREEEVKDMEQQKKGLMQKIFSQQLRFADSNNNPYPDWVSTKLGSAFDTITDFVAAGSFADLRKNVEYKNVPDYAQLVRTVDIKKRFNNDDFVYVSKLAYDYLWRVQLNDEVLILPNIGANIGESYFVTPKILPYERNVLGPNAILLKSHINNIQYLYQYTLTDSFKKDLFLCVGASGQPKFNKTELKTINIPIPCLEEQQKIANVLSKLDELIEEKKALLSDWQQFKKGLLQQMFV